MICFGFNIPSIADQQISKKKILIRVDFNIKIKGDKVIDDTRIRQVLPSLKKLLKNNNKLILITHFGKPKKRDNNFSVKPIAKHLKKLLKKYDVQVVDDFLDKKSKNIFENQRRDEILILENIRFYPQEKENDAEFAQKLAGLADIYVNDAFGVCHRKHASVVGLPKYLPSYSGLLLEKEVCTILDLMDNPKKPFVAVIGGAKISTKLVLIKKLLKKCDFVLVGGGLANTFFKAQDLQIGKSIYEPEVMDQAAAILKDKKTNGHLVLPKDIVIETDKKEVKTVETDSVPENAYIYDIGKKTIHEFERLIKEARTVVFNGPVGFFENKKYAAGTEKVVRYIAENKIAKTVVGGGDTLASLPKKILNQFDHVSTGGGAMLKLIENETLPALEALRKKD